MLMIQSCWESWTRLRRKVNYWMKDIKIHVFTSCSVSFSILFCPLSKLECLFQPSVILTFCVAGLRVLLTHVECAIPSPQFLARLARPAGCCLPGFRKHGQPTHPEFCLFLSTQLPVQLLRRGKKDL